MKIKSILLASIIIATISCSKKDDPIVTQDTSTISTAGDDVVTTFFPNILLNSWTFASTTTIVTPTPANGTLPTTATDVLRIDADVIENSIAYKIMKTSPANPMGFYCNMVNNNKLRVVGSSVKMTGNINFNVSSNPIMFSVKDFTIFKENAVAGTEVGIANGIFDTTIQASNGSAVPVSGNYNIKSVADVSLASLVVGNITYNDVKKTIITINITGNANLGTTSIAALLAQDVVVSTQYYAKGVGVIKAETIIKYEFAPTVASLFPATVSTTGRQDITENLTSKTF